MPLAYKPLQLCGPYPMWPGAIHPAAITISPERHRDDAIVFRFYGVDVLFEAVHRPR